MTNWVVQRKFLKIEREAFAALLSIIPGDKRALVMNEVKQKPYASAVRYFLRNHFPDWPDAMIEDYGNSLLRGFNAIRNARNTARWSSQPFYSPLKRAWSQSLEDIQWAFRSARPSGTTVEAEMTIGKTTITGSLQSGRRVTYKMLLSPAYKRLTDKIGIKVYKHYVILEGFLVMKPFDGGEIWCCRVEDTKKQERKTVYIGRNEDDFVAHSNLAACITYLEKAVATKCLLAFRGGGEDDEIEI